MAGQEPARPVVSLNRLSLALGSRAVLDRVSLCIARGSITSLIGPSGSGKSTLLRCLNRLVEPPPGTVHLDGQDITTLDVITLRRRVGLVFQQPAMFAGTVAENLALGPGYAGAQLPEQRILGLLDLVGLPRETAWRPAQQLSGGQGQRVALARVLANEPEVLLLDEPTSALDPKATRHVEQAVRRLNSELGITVVWVSHSVEQVARTADDVGLLADGRLVEFGRADHLLSGEHRHLSGDFAAGRLGDDGSGSHHPPEASP